MINSRCEEENNMHAMLKGLVEGPAHDAYWYIPSPHEEILRDVWGSRVKGVPNPYIWEMSLLANQVLEER